MRSCVSNGECLDGRRLGEGNDLPNSDKVDAQDLTPVRPRHLRHDKLCADFNELGYVKVVVVMVM